MHKIVLLRHGESIWNKENRFTGWTDVDLSDRGIEEAKKAAQVLKKENFVFDVAFTSVLKRAIRTLFYGLCLMKWILCGYLFITHGGLMSVTMERYRG